MENEEEMARHETGISKNLELPLFLNYRSDFYLSLLAAAIIGNFSAVIVHYAAYTV